MARSICARNWRNSVARWRRLIRPCTSPVATLKAAYQIRGPVSLVVVGAALDLPGPQGQHRMGPVERLNLRLLVDREDQRVLGRVEGEPDHLDHCSANCGS